MKKRVGVFLAAAVVVAGGAWFVKHEATNVVATKVSQEISTPAGQASVHKILQSKQVQSQLSKGNSSGQEFKTQEQAIQFAASKLSPSEMAQLANGYAHPDSLSAEQKAKLEQELLSKFTPQQLAAMAKTFGY
ncbi:hypothetical protein [Alicyclobacillus dauci]|uniref:Host cell surface-exposed lipoprotein n=1 Tax=Alicyclobacillus dauci TaxID=1475485 RepID=A0ABY6Z5V5_9BACL|nr:hypothetical protein [Alicyclobacillus dauci]WAH37893.1 hypothetical protein NZD86_05170 [Alicyclobacillus dauci]